MKKIINRRKYDTQTAEYMAEASANCATTDFCYWAEWLYKKRTGEFFIYGAGNAASRWSESCDGGNSRSGSRGIRPLTEDEAREWVERYANDRYEAIFGECEE